MGQLYQDEKNPLQNLLYGKIVSGGEKNATSEEKREGKLRACPLRKVLAFFCDGAVSRPERGESGGEKPISSGDSSNYSRGIDIFSDGNLKENLPHLSRAGKSRHRQSIGGEATEACPGGKRTLR